jgi:arylsulfatase A-like enzyme
MNPIRQCLFLAVILLHAPLIDAATEPNVVVILGDDQAWSDYGFMGHPVIETPQLDRLSERSLVFGRGYVAAPLCRPSLASIATGLFPFQHGVTGNDVDGFKNRDELDMPVQAEFHRHPSFIKMLTSHGYLAHQSGKWWEGSYEEGGFTHGMTHGDPERGGRHGDEGLKIGREGIKPITDFIDHAISEEKPFLLWYAPFLPHTPHNPPERLLEKYQKAGRTEEVAKYYAMCEWFDETCGELLDYLDKKGQTDNTLVLFISDNGWAASSTNAADPNQKTWEAYALRSKGSPYEDGIRNPILVSWPGHLEPRRSEDFAHAIDFFPTIAAATGLEAPDDLPGLNLLDPETLGKRERVFGETHAIHNMTLGQPDETLHYLWCVEREWKLILRFPAKDTTRYAKVHAWDTAPARLYRIREDPHERNDLAEERPEVVERIKGEIKAWRERLAEVN